MSTLQAMQQQMLQAVLGDSAWLPPSLQGDALADAHSRLDVYRHGYRMRLREAIAPEFPGLALMAGRRMEGLLRDYVAAHPSTHYNIRWHGAGLPDFLARELPWREQPQLADMARLDWAISIVFDAADQPTWDATALADLPAASWASLRLRLQDHVQIVAGASNVDAFRRAADRGDARPRLRRFPDTRDLLVWRRALEVRYRRLEADERLVLDGIAQDERFDQLCERLAGHLSEQAAMARMVALLARWLDEGLLAAPA